MRKLAILVIAAGLLQAADVFPTISGTALSGAAVTLPEAGSGHATVVVVGFTHTSQTQSDAWVRKLGNEFAFYSLAVIEDAPRLVRGMITSGMRSGVAKAQQGRVLTVTKGEKELKVAVGFEQADDAYVVVLDGTGAITWRYHGAPTDAAVAELHAQAESAR